MPDKENNMRRLILSLLCLFFTCLLCAVDVEGVFGIYRVVLHDKSGTFSIYMENAKNSKYVPVLNSLDSSSGTRFYLKAGSFVHVLSKSAGIPVSQYLTDTGFRVEYTVKNLALVALTFTFVSSDDGKLGEFSDVIIADIFVTNTSGKTDSFALKAVFDTVLGESVAKHFSTNSFPVINEEMSFSSMYVDKWIRTSDGNNSMQFLLDGDTITRPLSVTLANRDILLTDVWTPTLIPGRGFNSLFSFNNSALCIHWNSYRIAPKLQSAVRFYITAASNEQNPANTSSSFFTGGKAAEISAEIMVVQEQAVEEIIEPPVVYDVTGTAPVNDKGSLENPKKTPVDDTSIQDENPYVYDEPIKEEQLDPAYIEALLAKIESLEAESTEIDREEILRLNAELDAILEYLRR